MADTRDTIRSLEDRRYRAMVAADAAALDELLADSMIYTHSSSLVDTKASYLEGMRNGKWKYKKIDRPVEDIQVHGSCAVVTGHVRIEVVVDGTPKSLNSRYLDVWLQGPKGWQMVAWQSTPIPG